IPSPVDQLRSATARDRARHLAIESSQDCLWSSLQQDRKEPLAHEPCYVPNEVAVVVRLIGRNPQLLSREVSRERAVHQQRIWAELFRGEEYVEPSPLDRRVNIIGGDE